MVPLSEVEAARERLRGRVRRTPLVDAVPVRRELPVPWLGLKLECLQIGGSFKARGATNKLLTLPPGTVAKGLVTASGGNHGLGVAYAAWQAGVPARIYLPEHVPPAKEEKLRQWGAELVRQGEAWDDANDAAVAAAARDGLAYVHPFADPAVIAGQGTIGLEILEDAPEIDLLLVSIGGGGLAAGVAAAARAVRPGLRVVGVEPVGAPTLTASLEAGRLVELAEIRTAAGTLAPRKTAEINLEIVRREIERIVLVTDDEMREAARWLWFELGIAAELSGAAAVAALLAGKVDLAGAEKPCAIVCGAGTDGIGP